MTQPTLSAAQVMDSAASLLNDTAKTVYTYIKQLPYLNMALQELQEYFELNEVPVVDTISAIMTVSAGTSSIGFAASGLKLPDDLIEPQILWERATGTNPFVMMTRVDSLPRNLEGTTISQLLYYVWQSQELRFLPADASNDVKMDYIRNLFTPITLSTDSVFLINAATFLEYRTGGLIAEFIGENSTRANSLNNFASLAMDRIIGIGTKGRQHVVTRHRPFRSSYKQRSGSF